MGGGTPRQLHLLVSAAGLSPRGRGNRLAIKRPAPRNRSIPAWAGEPQASAELAGARRVYPRVGGGTRHGSPLPGTRWGLSPRGRGNPHQIRHLPPRRGSIPAWAGEPSPWGPLGPLGPVYPRVGGGTPGPVVPDRISIGLSPRGRGNPRPARSIPAALGSIPAWAGEPQQQPGSSPDGQVYPRVGGGTSWWPGLSPPGRGLSPRGRGNHYADREPAAGSRSIPAWAGEPDRTHGGNHGKRVYPRVGGGTPPARPAIAETSGLSPRGRGNPKGGQDLLGRGGSIPAWAGEPPLSPLSPFAPGVYPRVGGGTPPPPPHAPTPRGLSPRGRGNP